MTGKAKSAKGKVKNNIILSVLAKKTVLYQLKTKIIYNLMIFVATKNDRTKNSPSSFGAVVGSGIGIRDG
jgi:hypothetical protein